MKSKRNKETSKNENSSDPAFVNETDSPPEQNLTSQTESSNTEHISNKTKKKSEKKKKSSKKNTFTFRKTYDRIKKKFKLLKDERTKKAIILCKDEILFFLKKIFPKKIKGEIEIGLKDPASTGEVFGLYSALYPIHKGNIIMTPYFDQEIFKYYVKGSGHIRVITLLVIAIKIYFNKDVKRLIRIFQEEDE